MREKRLISLLDILLAGSFGRFVELKPSRNSNTSHCHCIRSLSDLLIASKVLNVAKTLIQLFGAIGKCLNKSSSVGVKSRKT